MALGKSFALWRESRLELRFEAFNVLNKTNFRAPNGNRSAAALGQISTTLGPATAPARGEARFGKCCSDALQDRLLVDAELPHELSQPSLGRFDV